MFHRAVTFLLGLLAVPAAFAAPEVSHVYASKLDLSCDPQVESNCLASEGEKVRWFRRVGDQRYQAIHSGIDGPVKVHSAAKPFPGDVHREFWSEDRPIAIAYVYPLADGKCTPAARFTFKEVERPTAFAAGLNQILKALFESVKDVSGGPPVKIGASEANACVVSQVRKLKELRALASMTVSLPKGKDENELSTHAFITGPREHFFISGDVITRKLSQLEFDRATNTVKEKEKPGLVYLGVNYMVGDVYLPAPGLSADRLVAKAMISAASKPLDSVGVGLGYRIGDFLFPTGGTKPQAILVYAGHYWTKGENGGGRKNEWRVGLSFNVETFLGWVKPEKPAK